MSAVLVPEAPPFPRPLRQLVADPGRVGAAGTELLAASARLDDTGELARTDGVLPGWEGKAGDAYRAELRPYARRADAMSLALRAVGRRVEEHADAMRLLLLEQDDLEVDNRALTDEVFAFADRARLLEQRAAAAPADPGLVEDVAALRVQAVALAVRVHRLDARQVDWWTRVVAEETAMVDAFSAVLDVAQVEHRYGDRPDPADPALLTFPGAGAPPGVVLAWWRGLTQQQRQAVLVAAPGAVGNLDGVRAGDRDAANRVRLSRDLATLRHLEELGQLTDREEATLANAEAVQRALDRHADDTDVRGRRVPTLLWVYDPGAFVQDDGAVDGRVAIAVGDPDTADTIAINVPGIKTEALDIGTYTDRAWELHQAATTADPGRSYASIAWLGYDAPPEVEGVGDLAAVRSAAPAADGGERLAHAIDGLQAVRGDDADVVPIGHSYGSVALGAALSDHDVDVDRAVVVGSPGMGRGIDDVGDLGLERGQLYVGRNQDDLVAGLAQNGSLGLGGVGQGQDPADAGFGGVRFQANAGPGHDDHSAYYDNDSESLHNLGLVLAGQEPSPAGPVQDRWWWPAHDPEAGASSALFDTDGDRDVDGIPRR